MKIHRPLAAAALALTVSACLHHDDDDNKKPQISSIDGKTVLVDNRSDAIPFSVSDRETAATMLTISASSGNTSLLPDNGIALSGADSARFITLTPAAGMTGTALITLTVADSKGASASSQFVLTVQGRANSTTLVRDIYGKSASSEPIVLTNVDLLEDSDDATFVDLLTDP